MAMTPGSRLGAYEILSTLGAGGMGAVYRARDVKLGREVAVKVILDVFAADPERIARFEREAKMLASLNHPHIAALYGMEQAGGQHFLVLELVEGDTLADRIKRGPLPAAETILVALQIADALEAAHEKGIVHRDLKPANVKITPDDRVKVLDFGLAKAIENEASAANVANSPTLSMMASQAGVILGTAAYMSPEQAKGFPADHRSDIFSFGTVLFEMLTGRQPFHGETAPEVLASVLVREPELARLPADLHPRFADMVRRCLEKHPKRRWQAIGDVRAELEAIAAAPQSAPIAPARPPQALWTRLAIPAVAALAGAALAGTAAWTLKPPPPQPVMRFVVALPADQRVTTPGRNAIALSPDAATLVYVVNNQIYVRALRDAEGKSIYGSATALSSPAISPDGRSVVFFSNTDQVLKRIAIGGGAAVTLCGASNPYGITWTGGGIIYGQSIGATRGIFRVAETGGTPVPLIKVAADELVYGPQVLPDGKTIVFTLARGVTGADRWDAAQIVAQTPGSSERKVLIEGGADARYLPTGHLAFARRGVVYAVPFDASRVAVAGDPVALIEGVRRAANATTGLADFAVSNTGLLAYAPGPAAAPAGVVDLALADLTGATTSLKVTGALQTPRISRDGTRVAFAIDDGKGAAVYVYGVDGATAMQRLTFGGNNRLPVWTPDGKRVTFQSDREGDRAIFWQAADGAGAAERLTRPAAGESHEPMSWHPGGDVLLFDVTRGTESSLWIYSRRDGKAAPFGNVSSNNPTGAVFSPDGRWVAYAAGERGTPTVFVQPYPATGAKYEVRKVAGSGPHHPVWSPDGKQIYYVPRPGGMESVSVTTVPAFAFGNPETVARSFEAAPPGEQRPYDMAADGRFVGTVVPGQRGPSAAAPLEIQVVVNWLEEVRQRVPR